MTRPDFQDRLARIQTNSAAIESTTPTPKPVTKSMITTDLVDFFMVPFAFVCGFGAVLLAMLINFHYLNGYGEVGMTSSGLMTLFGGIIAEIAIAIALSVFFSVVFNLHSQTRGMAEFIGFCVGLFGMVELMAVAPSLFGMLFSNEFVAFNLYDDW